MRRAIANGLARSPPHCANKVVRVELEGQAGLPKGSKAAADAVDLAVRLRVRASGAAT